MNFRLLIFGNLQNYVGCFVVAPILCILHTRQQVLRFVLRLKHKSQLLQDMRNSSKNMKSGKRNIYQISRKSLLRVEDNHRAYLKLRMIRSTEQSYKPFMVFCISFIHRCKIISFCPLVRGFLPSDDQLQSKEMTS